MSAGVQRRVSIWLWLFVALLLGHALVIATSPNPPVLQDYPDWVYQGVLFAKLVGGHAVAGYALKHYPVPNSLTTIGVGSLTLLFGWAAAAKIWLLLVLAALGGAAVHFVRRLGVADYAVLPIYAVSLIAGLDLWNGSINFQLSMAFYLLFLAHLLKPERSEATTALLLLLCFFTHMLPCGAGLFALGAVALQQRSLRVLLPAVPTLFCVGWYALERDPGPKGQPMTHLLPALLAAGLVLLWGFRNGDRSRGALRAAALSWPPALPAPVLFWGTKLIILLGWLAPLNVLTATFASDRVLWPFEVFLVWSLAGVCAAVLGLILLRIASVQVCRNDDVRRFLGATALAFGAMYLFSPSDALGVTGFDSRLLHLGLGAGIGLLGLVPGKRLNALASLAVFIGAINLFQFAAVQRRPGTISVGYEHHVLFGVDPVAPAIRLPYYESLRTGQLNRWIFPTAMFRQTP